ncbi:MAG: DNRLRE domain-containing protein [Bacilli bacterium]|nr:DNRLRE domain-containing protein [Bacilli bacterium]
MDKEMNHLIQKNLNNASGIEILSKRGRREKHFLQKDGNIIATIYSDDVHFKNNGKYEEIDNRLIKTGQYYRNTNNLFKVFFKENSNNKFMGYEIFENNLSIEVLNNNNVPLKKIFTENQYAQTVRYEEIFKGVDFEYIITSTKVKEKIIIKNKESILEKIVFKINTDLKLQLNEDGYISVFKNDIMLFNIEKPYMFDSNNIINNDVKYVLYELNDGYQIELIIDQKWLSSENIVYPVIIDPTINVNKEQDVSDVVLDEQDPNKNLNDYFFLSAGVREGYSPNQGKYYKTRSLIKFKLPEIGTGSQIIGANMNLISYWNYPDTLSNRCVDIHRVTHDWNEKTATWNNMSNNYDKTIEANLLMPMEEIPTVVDGHIYKVYSADITSLVKHWYADTPNYGVLLKNHNEIYIDEWDPSFYSKDNQLLGPGAMPVLQIRYLNQNGIEDYMKYEQQSLANGYLFENLYNGNVVMQLNIGDIFGGNNPFSLYLVYNSNDVILNHNYGYGLGFQLSVQERINEVKIDSTQYLEHVDMDGTFHYYIKDTDVYKDEEGKGNTIKKDDNGYYLTDINGNIKTFSVKGYLTKYTGISGDEIKIKYNSNDLIEQISNEKNEQINLLYESDNIKIVSPSETVNLNYVGSRLNNIVFNEGTLSFSYNEYNLINNIVDVNNTGFSLNYYDILPYRVKKILEFGKNNSEGNHMTFSYGNNLTTTIDSKNRISTINFNNMGNPITTSTWKKENDVNGAYSSKTEYPGEEFPSYYQNKIWNRELPIRYIKNYLKNPNFENEQIIFSPEKNATLSISQDSPYDGNQSLKIVTLEDNTDISYEIEVAKGNYYTFSGYIKGFSNASFILSYQDELGEIIEQTSSVIYPDNEYDRYDVSIFYPDTAKSKLLIKINMNTPGTFYLDNIQLEEGRGANLFNCVENSDFSDGLNGWIINEEHINQYEIVKEDNVNALKLKMDVDKSTTVTKEINMKGEDGDIVNIGFWYKNLGIASDSYFRYNTVTVFFNYTEEVLGYGIEPISLKSNNNMWQYYSKSFVARGKFDKITIDFWQANQANDLYITNISVLKGINNNYTYDYDENGQLVSFSEFGKDTQLSFDNNRQLTSIVADSEDKLMFEYDNKIVNRPLYGLSKDGIVSSLKYDKNGNIISNKTLKLGNSTFEPGIYKIRMKGTNKYLHLLGHRVVLTDDACACSRWKIEKQDEFIKIFHTIIKEKCWCVQGNNLSIGNYCNVDNALFILRENDNGSYSIISKDNKIFYFDNDFYGFGDAITEENSYQLYFESVNNDCFFEENAIYTENGKYKSKVVDRLLCETEYEVNDVTGLATSVTDALKNKIKYEYDNKNHLTKVINGIKEINYDYNEDNNLASICQNKRKYNFIYDDFFNIKSIKLGDNILLFDYIRENGNGNVMSLLYGNISKIDFTYDNFDRVESMQKDNCKFEYIYGANNELLKVISDFYIDTFSYDLKKRLIKYNNSDSFTINYSYDKNSNIINKNYKIYNVKNKVKSEYNFNNDHLKTIFDKSSVKYNYDDLGRIESININNVLNTNYEYISNGKRASKTVKKVSNNGDVYDYKYNKNGNLTRIIHNNRLENKYNYDNFNQLIKEDNILFGETIVYKYDEYGNLHEKKKYKLGTYELIDRQKYLYDDNWVDQLKQYNNQEISYDAIGNPLTYGNIKYKWVNGRELSEYKDESNTIRYIYNAQGIRTQKIVNGIETNYYLEGQNIIFITKGTSLLYFFRENDGNLIGFRKDNENYYYIKNLQNDIIGIIDENSNIIAQYEYDSWGKIVSIKDLNGEIINDETHIANINPFRYRSYYYDIETGLYYLNNRYYNPIWGRFINPDSEIYNDPNTVGHNLYVYADNNPVNKADVNGNISFFTKIFSKFFSPKNVGKTIGATFALATGFYNLYTGLTNPKRLQAAIGEVAKSDKKYIKKHFTVEFGSGIGYSTPRKNAYFEAYQDLVKLLDKGNWIDKVIGGGSVTVGNITISSDYSCEYNSATNKSGNKGNRNVNAKCVDPEVTETFDLELYRGLHVSASNDGELFIGFSESGHLILGGHYRIGLKFNVNDF